MLIATSYEEWCSAALERDEESGNLAWRKDDTGGLIDSELMREHITQLRELIASGEVAKLAELLYESIYRHQGDIANPHLYDVAYSGTKLVIEDYLDAVEDSLNSIADGESTELSIASKLSIMRRAQRNLGESALLLSGGASMGFFHMGVAKALLTQGLLPKTICGASMGALIGGGLCSRNDEELHELFSDLEIMYRTGITFLKPAEMVKQRLLLDQSQLQRCADENIGELTFAEAAERSGRHFCVSVSPSRSRQKPRVLSSKTSPHIVVSNAVIASCAIPGVYPPVSLKARNKKGETVPYLLGEQWVDGTFQGDLPMKRLGRLFNINHFIVSQVNPHAVPFLVSRHGRGPLALAADLTLSTVRIQMAQTLKVLQGRVTSPRIHNVMEHGRLLAEQEYKGDINIHPQMNGWMYRRLLSNPSVADLKHYISLGERATWPKISMIRNQTRTQATLASCVKRLEASAG
jgi:TAG lipase/steryl ester hydrolase/phospholipase A2/LPA acyltransferase